jgi:LPXTG-motif cell wall-anchored protein
MDWFERLTGFDPDASTGTFEAMLVTVLGIAIVAVAAYVISRRTKPSAR